MASLPSLSELLNPPLDAVRPYTSSPNFVNGTPVRLPAVVTGASVGANEGRHGANQLFHGHGFPGVHNLNTSAGPSPRSPLPDTSRATSTPVSTFHSDPGRRSNSLNAEQWRYYEASTHCPRPPSLAISPTFHSDRASDRQYHPVSPGGLLHHHPLMTPEMYAPGESTGWVYNEGNRAPKAVNGDGVNPQWGTTKAGKPRKRLAQACTTCREKKIKCLPATPKCAQCMKFGRECHFESAPRNSHHTPTTPSMQQSLPDSPSLDFKTETVSPQGSVPAHAGGTSHYGDSLTNSSVVPSADPSPRPLKRQRFENLSRESIQFTSSTEVQPRTSASDDGKRTMSSVPIPNVNLTDDQNTALAWDVDPYEVDPESACHYMNLYFTHINVTSYCMFPRAPFMRWCKTDFEKCPQDRMVVYSLLAMGSVFSDREQHVSDGKRFAKTASYALSQSKGHFTLQLVHARLMVGLYYFAVGETGKSWDLCGMALRSASALKLNLEEGVTDLGDAAAYGLNKAGLIECRRRTFWSSYIMDRFNGFCSGHLCIINNDDCLLRLPLSEYLYERQESAVTPFFGNDIVDPTLSTEANDSNLGAMAYHAQISSLWGDILANIYRSSHRSPHDYAAVHEKFYERYNVRLQQWLDNLPPHLLNSPENTDAAIRNGYIGTYVALHALYHTALMKLNRHCRWSLLDADLVARNISRAFHHARAVLQTVRILSRTDRQARLPDVEFAFSTPFTSFSILTAVDILSAAGKVSDLSNYSQLIDSGLELVTDLGRFWSIARRHRKTILRRIKDLGDAAQIPIGEKTVFAIDRAMEITFDEDQDIMYSVPRERLFTALGIGADSIAKDKVLWVQASYDGGIGYI